MADGDPVNTGADDPIVDAVIDPVVGADAAAAGQEGRAESSADQASGSASGPQTGPGETPTPVGKSRSLVKDMLKSVSKSAKKHLTPARIILGGGYLGLAGTNWLYRGAKTTIGGAKDATLNVLRPFESSISTLGSSIAKRTTQGFSQAWNVVDWKERSTQRESWYGRAAQWTWDATSNVSRFGLKTATAAVVGTAFILGGTAEGGVRGTGRFLLDASSIQYSPEGSGAEARAAVKPAEIADACKSKLSGDKAQEIAAAGSMGDSIGLAMTALAEAGVDDPEAFLREKGVLSSGTVPFTKRWSLARDRGLVGLGLTVKDRTWEGLVDNTKGAAVAPALWVYKFVGKEGHQPSLSDLQQAAAAFKGGAKPYKDALKAVGGEDPGVWDYAKAAFRMPEKEFQAAALAAMEITGHKDGFWAAVPSIASAIGYVVYGEAREEDEAVEKLKPEYGNFVGRLSAMSDKVLEAFVEKFDGSALESKYASLVEGAMPKSNNEDYNNLLRKNLQKELKEFFGLSGASVSRAAMNLKLSELARLKGNLNKLILASEASSDKGAKTKARAQFLVDTITKIEKLVSVEGNKDPLAEIFPAKA